MQVDWVSYLPSCECFGAHYKGKAAAWLRRVFNVLQAALSKLLAFFGGGGRKTVSSSPYISRSRACCLFKSCVPMGVSSRTRYIQDTIASVRSLFNNHGKRGPKHEARKVIVAGSLIAATWPCLIHLIPVLTSSAIIAVNVHGFYIGIDFPGAIKSDTMTLLFLQVAAKVQEILIVASLSQIIFQFVRHELLFGDGLPLGLIGSGLAFNNFGFYFTKEFYGALKYLAFQRSRWRKISFVVLLVVCGLTSLLAGPASAVLLVPKAQAYPAGGTEFYLDGSMEDFWPQDLSNISELQTFCSSSTSTSLGICPAGGFVSLQQQWASLNYSNFIEQNIPDYAKLLSGSRFYWPVHSRASQIPPLYAVGNPRQDRPDLTTPEPYTWLVQAHAASAVTLQRLTTDWWEVLSSQLGVKPLLVDDRNVQASVKSSISSVRCASPQNMTASDNVLEFPTIQGRWTWSPNAAYTDQSLNSTAVDHVRFHWVHLPSAFGPISIGGVFESPWVADQKSRLVIGCSAQTGWVPTQLCTNSYNFWSGWYPWGIKFGARTPSWTDVADGEELLPTNGRIALGDDWLKLLTPAVPMSQSEGEPLSTIETILEDVGLASTTATTSIPTLTEDWLRSDHLSNAGKTRFLEAIICSMLADGLSRSGSHRVFNTTGPASAWALAMYNPRTDFGNRILNGQPAFESPHTDSANVTILDARMQISGYSFQISLAGYLSMSVLLAHILMASAHIYWLIKKRQTSRNWGTISELITLAQNSRPAIHALENTGAGIEHLTTFARIARIRVRQQPEFSDLEHVELLFGDEKVVFSEPQGSLDEPRTTSGIGVSEPILRGRGGSWTFPLSYDRLYAHVDIEREPSPDLRERLLSRDDTAKNIRHDRIHVDSLYG